MKISIGRVFDSGQVLKMLTDAGVKGMDEFITYLYDMSTQLVNALRGTLTIEDNLNSLVKNIELKHNVRLAMQLPDRKKTPRHVFLTRAIPIENSPLSFGWQMLQDGNLEMLATFTGAPTAAVQVTVVILF